MNKTKKSVDASDIERKWSDLKNWKKGLFYSCPDDPRVIVGKRHGFGWTMNFAHPHAFAVMFGILGAMLVPFGVLLFLKVPPNGVLWSLTGVLVVAATCLFCWRMASLKRFSMKRTEQD